jgi:hypothetical protein
MSSRNGFRRELRVFALAALTALPCLGRGLAAAPVPTSERETAGTAAASEAAIADALALLPRRPRQVVVIDPAHATPKGREILARTDAFVVEGGDAVYVNLASEVLEGARRRSRIHLHMLAAIVWHEMAHLEGADEAQAQQREEALWLRFLRDERVERTIGLRYLQLMKERRLRPPAAVTPP